MLRNFICSPSLTYNVKSNLGPICQKHFVLLLNHVDNQCKNKFYHSLSLRQSFNYCVSSTNCYSQGSIQELKYIDYGSNLTDLEKATISKDMLVIDSFLSFDEEKFLLNEIEPYMRRLRYEFDHWDNAIHGFRETERLNWNEENTKIINRVKECAFMPGTPQLRHVHILDLDEKGYIKPHIDSVRFCGNTIAGLSLLTDSVMRLIHDKDKTKIVDVFLKRCSLYIMRDSVRYDYTHEILPNEKSKFKQVPVEKKRRISIICRNEPSPC